VFFSLLVARLITPVIAAFTLRADSIVIHTDGPIMERYMRVLRWCIDHRWQTLAGGTLFFILSIGALKLLPQSFVPEGDGTSSQLDIELPPGVRLEQTAALAAQATAVLKREPEVTDVVESVGADETGEVRRGTLYITLVPRSQRDMTQHEWEQSMVSKLEAIPDARLNFHKMSGAGMGRDVTLFLAGDDPKVLEASAHRLEAQMRGLPHLTQARINADLQRPEIVIHPKLDLAAELGVTVASISQTIRIATLGDLPQNVAKFSLSDRLIPIRVSLLESTRQDISTLENLPVPTTSGTTVPLKAVADISFGQGPTRIRRYNQNRRIAIDADLNGIELGPAMKEIKALPELRNLPLGVRLIEVGEAEVMKELYSNFGIAMATGVLMVFAVLVLLFVRVFQPITILSALPLSIGGAALALFIGGYPMSLPVVIGFLMLMGIVAKNSILLVDFAIEEMRAGKDRTTALLESGHKRARPIVMTTVAMIAGMVPVIMGLHGDASFRAPMAVAVIGGLATSTLLTLVIVPAAFTLIDDIEAWLGPRVRAMIAAAPTTPEAAKSEPAAET
jgi:multidrug efflux pump subunit AcrB